MKPVGAVAAAIGGLLFAAAQAVLPAAAASVEPFYAGRTVTLMVGVSPGGINDISARLVARHLGRFIPGAPTIVVQNLPGAGGLATANRLYNTAERDGSVIAGLERAVAQLAIAGNRNAAFDPQKFTWLGSLSSYANDAYLLLVNDRHPARRAADLMRPDVLTTLGADHAGSSNLVFALIAKHALGLNVNIVRGYAGAANIFLAMQGGEVDGQIIGLASTRTGQRDLWERHAVRPLVQFGRVARLPDMADVATGRELAPDEATRALLEFAELPFFMALPFLAPPAVPADRAEALQAGFARMAADPAFRDDAERLGLEISPIDAASVRALLARAAATPKDVIDRYNALIAN